MTCRGWNYGFVGDDLEGNGVAGTATPCVTGFLLINVGSACHFWAGNGTMPALRNNPCRFLPRGTSNFGTLAWFGVRTYTRRTVETRALSFFPIGRQLMPTCYL